MIDFVAPASRWPSVHESGLAAAAGEAAAVDRVDDQPRVDVSVSDDVVGVRDAAL